MQGTSRYIHSRLKHSKYSPVGHIIHKDGDPTNNDLCNLQYVDKVTEKAIEAVDVHIRMLELGWQMEIRNARTWQITAIFFAALLIIMCILYITKGV